jgi:hypothetical protein
MLTIGCTVQSTERIAITVDRNSTLQITERIAIAVTVRRTVQVAERIAVAVADRRTVQIAERVGEPGMTTVATILTVGVAVQRTKGIAVAVRVAHRSTKRRRMLTSR